MVRRKFACSHQTLPVFASGVVHAFWRTRYCLTYCGAYGCNMCLEGYYASVLSLLGTAILGILTLRQNKIAQEKSEEVNRLQLALQRKSMAMAEAQYNKDGDEKSAPPKFEVSLKGYSGTYCNMRLEIKKRFLCNCFIHYSHSTRSHKCR